jgi:hypothetical protein
MSKKKPVQRESIATPTDLSEVLKDAPPGAWIALSRDRTRIVGTGTSLNLAAYQAQLNNESNPVLIRMPSEDEGIAAGVR